MIIMYLLTSCGEVDKFKIKFMLYLLGKMESKNETQEFNWLCELIAQRSQPKCMESFIT